MTSGINPPSMMPSKLRVKKNVLRPVIRLYEQATTLQHTICIGIQLSGPSFLDMSCGGSSASKNDT